MQDADIKAANAREVRKQYHPALCNAMELELYYDKDLLEFSQSVVLNTLPREIDFLVIRRTKPGQVSELAAYIETEGKSYKEPIYNDDGTVNNKASRRVEFKIILNY